jgi:DNA repair exonuclease SbcCD nuclease subunit
VAVIVHAADLHIDGPADRARSSRRAVIRLVDFALAERADLVVIAGDVFDREADSTAAGRFFASEMGRLGDAGVTVLAVAGNHDIACPLANSYSRHLRWFPTDAPGTVLLDELRVAVHGQGLADPTEPRDLSAGFPPPVPGYLNLGLLHTSLDGARSRTLCAPTSVERLVRTGYDYWALGHVHERRVLATDPWIAYAGSLPGGATVITSMAGAVAWVAHRDLALSPARVRTPA